MNIHQTRFLRSRRIAAGINRFSRTCSQIERRDCGTATSRFHVAATINPTNGNDQSHDKPGRSEKEGFRIDDPQTRASRERACARRD